MNVKMMKIKIKMRIQILDDTEDEHKSRRFILYLVLRNDVCNGCHPIPQVSFWYYSNLSSNTVLTFTLKIIWAISLCCVNLVGMYGLDKIRH